MAIRFVSWNIETLSAAKSRKTLPSAYAQFATQRRMAAMAQVLRAQGADLVGVEEVTLRTGAAAAASLCAELNAQAGGGWSVSVSPPSVPSTHPARSKADAYAVLARSPVAVGPLAIAPAQATYNWLDRRPCRFTVTPPGASALQVVIWHAPQPRTTRTLSNQTLMIGRLAAYLRTVQPSGAKRKRVATRLVVAGDFNAPTGNAGVFASLRAAPLRLSDVVGGALTTLTTAATLAQRLTSFAGQWTSAPALAALFLASPYDDVFVSSDLTPSASLVDDVPADFLAKLALALHQPRSATLARDARAMGKALSDHVPVVTTIA